MKEKLHTIPVNEAFDTDCECPLCVMRQSLEDKAIDFVMGPSYMEDDIRAETSKLGFCSKHLELMYKNQNRLGLALILKSYMDKTIKDVEKQSSGVLPVASLFKKKSDSSPVVSYLEKRQSTCYICNKMNGTFDRYVDTIFHLYHTESSFRQKFADCKGFCTKHYQTLYENAAGKLSGDELKEFINILNSLYINNMKRVRDDLEWFIDKFDYRYADEPWKNSKDALPRTMIKTNSITKL